MSRSSEAGFHSVQALPHRGSRRILDRSSNRFCDCRARVHDDLVGRWPFFDSKLCRCHWPAQLCESAPALCKTHLVTSPTIGLRSSLPLDRSSSRFRTSTTVEFEDEFETFDQCSESRDLWCSDGLIVVHVRGGGCHERRRSNAASG